MRIRLLSNILERLAMLHPKLYISYLRKHGIRIGANTHFFGRQFIDATRPYLVEIGSNCVLTDGVTLLTHGFDWSVLREKYGEVLGSSGKVVVEDNVFIGTRAIILKGVRIGRDSIIGAGSIVTHNIPAGSVAAGNPCNVLMTIEEYYEKRKKEYVAEAKACALELYRKTGRVPKQSDFREEFPLFLDRQGEIDPYFRSQLGSSLRQFKASKPIYNSFAEFLIDAGIPTEKVIPTRP
jgi:acetyltransferase-like isoleucine patch superfamily enzyme